MTRGTVVAASCESLVLREPDAGAFALTNDVCHLWWIDLTSGDPTRLSTCLSDDERARAQRFVQTAHGHEYIRGRAALRTIVSRYLGCGADRVAIETGPHGRPTVSQPAGGRHCNFNLSHSGSRALLAIANSEALGVDIEQVRTVRDASALAARHYTDAERAWLQQYSGSHEAETFLYVWTRKEAVLKSTGHGLTVAPRTFDVAPHVSEADVSFAPEGRAQQLRVQSFVPAQGYCGALAASRALPLRAWQYRAVTAPAVH
jgi:4'-phosphopantetheinyl transferase